MEDQVYTDYFLQIKLNLRRKGSFNKIEINMTAHFTSNYVTHIFIAKVRKLSENRIEKFVRENLQGHIDSQEEEIETKANLPMIKSVLEHLPKTEITKPTEICFIEKFSEKFEEGGYFILNYVEGLVVAKVNIIKYLIEEKIIFILGDIEITKEKIKSPKQKILVVFEEVEKERIKIYFNHYFYEPWAIEDDIVNIQFTKNKKYVLKLCAEHLKKKYELFFKK